MNYNDAYRIALDLCLNLAPACEPDHCLIVGGIRRYKHDVHDIEIACKPLPGAPRPVFGDTQIFGSHLDKALFCLEQEGKLKKGDKNGAKMKRYIVNTKPYGFEILNPFFVEFYIVTPPAQWGVELVIRTGPNTQEDKFSQWCVTSRSDGGAMPEGYRQRHLAIWNVDQLDSKLEPRAGEEPVPMPTEQEFFTFLGIPYIDPPARHARWRR